MSLNVTPVSGRSGLDDFIKVPWAVYEDDPCWVPPLKMERRDALSPKHPFFEHARWQPFVAYRDGRAVGRISAQIDDLYQERHDPKGGFFGMFESIPDDAVIDGLFSSAEAWLAERGCENVVGPFNLGINQEVGLLVDGFDSSPFFMMGHGMPYYREALARLGYAEVQRMLAYEMPVLFERPRLMNVMMKQLGPRVTMRTLDRRNLVEELELLRDIFNDAWSENWKFVPWTPSEFLAVGKEMMMLIPPDFVQIAEVDGEPAAFIVMLPNLNEAIGDLDGRLLPFGWAKLLWRIKVRYPKSGRVPLMGVRRRFHHTRLGPGLAMFCISALREPSHRAGLERAELSWILEDNQGMRSILETVGGEVTRTYAMFEKSLSRGPES
jgi:hypothetical protein